MSGAQLEPAAVADLARRCFGPENKRLSTARDLRFGRRGSLSVDPGRGVFQDHEAGIGGGVLAMIVHAGAAKSPAEAARWLEGEGVAPARESPAERQRRDREADAERKRRMAVAGSLWGSARPWAGTAVETYLRRSRAVLAALDGASLRFLADAPLHPYGSPGAVFPAMIAKVENAAGGLIGAHLTYLRPDGLGKAAVTPDRKMIGIVGGGFVRLGAASRMSENERGAARYVVAEGLESALSAWEAAGGREAGFGALAALSAGGVARLAWPARTAEIVIAPDRDKAGEEAAQLLARRAHAAGLTVALMRPPIDCGDWNEWARRQGVAA